MLMSENTPEVIARVVSACADPAFAVVVHALVEPALAVKRPVERQRINAPRADKQDDGSEVAAQLNAMGPLGDAIRQAWPQ